AERRLEPGPGKTGLAEQARLQQADVHAVGVIPHPAGKLLFAINAIRPGPTASYVRVLQRWTVLPARLRPFLANLAVDGFCSVVHLHNRSGHCARGFADLEFVTGALLKTFQGAGPANVAQTGFHVGAPGFAGGHRPAKAITRPLAIALPC